MHISDILPYVRANKTKILEFLRDAWADDRRAEWSIWMVYSKIDRPHHQMRSGADDSSSHGLHKKTLSLQKIDDDVIPELLLSVFMLSLAVKNVKIFPELRLTLRQHLTL